MKWLRKFAGVGKMLFALIAVTVLVFILGHFGLQYGIGLGEVPKFFERTWLLWFVVRWTIYAASGYFLWEICKLVKNEADLAAYKKLVWVALIGAACIEIVVFTRLFGG